MSIPIAAGLPTLIHRKRVIATSRDAIEKNWVKVGMVFAVHAVLGVLMFKSTTIATAHALIVPLAGGIWILSKQHLERAACVGAYIAGAEVLWRMTEAQVFWEFGKYAIAGLFILALLRSGRAKWAILPLAYFLVLLPSVYLTLERFAFSYARSRLSFNLSGPFALMVCMWLFSNLKVRVEHLYKILVAFIAPVIGIASITALTTYSLSEISKADVSDKVTSGGFGPNQVSAALGLGVLFAIFFLLNPKSGIALKVVMFLVVVVLGVQSALTFSRGGLYMAALGTILASFYLMRKPGARIRIVAVIGAIVLVGNFFLLPRLDAFTGGALSTRFMNTSSTGRDKIVMIDLDIWRNNLILGVGPGVAMLHRYRAYKWIAAHTEFSRLLAEHGVFGLVAIALLIAMAVQAMRRANTVMGKALAAAMIGWTFLFLLVDGMRMAAPSLTFGLSWITFVSETKRASTYLRTTSQHLKETVRERSSIRNKRIRLNEFS
jgi:O-Antigen ligase